MGGVALSRRSIASQLVERSKLHVEEIIKSEMQDGGTTADAMRRVEDRFGIPYAVQWALKYRAPKDLYVSVVMQIEAAHRATIEKAGRRYRDERKTVEGENWLSARLLGAADALAGETSKSNRGRGGINSAA